MNIKIYFSNELEELDSYKKFFIKKLLFKDENYLSGKLFNVEFIEFSKFSIDLNSFDIILVDDAFVADASVNLQKTLLDKWQKSSQNILFVAISKNFANLELLASRVNFLQLYMSKDWFSNLEIEVYLDILKSMLNVESIKVFISYSRDDGSEIAINLKRYIDENTKLDRFFDIQSIHNSQNWQKTLQKEISECKLFIFVYSDSFSKKEWPQRELLWAKSSNKAIVAIDALTNQDSRVFPYIGNVKMIKYNLQDDFAKVISEGLKEAIKKEIFNIEPKKEYIVIKNHPELLNILNLNSNKILYPEPPIKLSEQEIYNNLNIELKTPLQEITINKELKVAISISEANDIEDIGLIIEHLHLLMVEIARYLLINRATLMYGGDIFYNKEEFNFTKSLVELLISYNKDYYDKKRLINFSVKPFSNKLSKAIKAEYKGIIEFIELGNDCTFEQKNIVYNNLSLLREEMTKACNARVVIGGKVDGFLGRYPGILEEVFYAIKYNKPIFIVGGFGGCAKEIVNFIQNRSTLLERYDIANYIKQNFNLNNGLSNQENEILFTSTNIYEIIKLIIKGLAKL